MTEFERYVVGEYIEDFNDGVISRRELIRRVTLITGSVAATAALLTAMGCGAETGPTGPTPAPTSRPTSSAQPFATPPAQPSQDGVTVTENDPRITVRPLPVTGADGATLISYAASSAGGAPAGGVLVVPENRGLTTHIKDVVRRTATAGFHAVSVDLLSREGGAERLPDPAAYAAALSRQPVETMVSDLDRALAALSSSGTGDRLGMVGFCFGGGMVLTALTAGARVKAAVPFYGPAPRDITALARTRAAVLMVYAGNDTRITASRDSVESALRQTGQPYRVTVYPGVDHAFHNDTGQRYDAAQAEAAWIATIDWLRQYVR